MNKHGSDKHRKPARGLLGSPPRRYSVFAGLSRPESLPIFPNGFPANLKKNKNKTHVGANPPPSAGFFASPFPFSPFFLLSPLVFLPSVSLPSLFPLFPFFSLDPSFFFIFLSIFFAIEDQGDHIVSKCKIIDFLTGFLLSILSQK